MLTLLLAAMLSIAIGDQVRLKPPFGEAQGGPERALRGTRVEGPDTTGVGLEARLRELIASSGAEVAVAYRTLDGRTELLIDPDKSFHAASTMKVPVMIELFRQARAGTRSLDEPLADPQRVPQHRRRQPVRAERGRRLGQGGLRRDRTTLTLRQLCEAMITLQQQLRGEPADRESSAWRTSAGR